MMHTAVTSVILITHMYIYNAIYLWGPLKKLAFS